MHDRDIVQSLWTNINDYTKYNAVIQWLTNIYLFTTLHTYNSLPSPWTIEITATAVQTRTAQLSAISAESCRNQKIFMIFWNLFKITIFFWFFKKRFAWFNHYFWIRVLKTLFRTLICEYKNCPNPLFSASRISYRRI